MARLANEIIVSMNLLGLDSDRVVMWVGLCVIALIAAKLYQQQNT